MYTLLYNIMWTFNWSEEWEFQPLHFQNPFYFWFDCGGQLQGYPVHIKVTPGRPVLALFQRDGCAAGLSPLSNPRLAAFYIRPHWGGLLIHWTGPHNAVGINATVCVQKTSDILSCYAEKRTNKNWCSIITVLVYLIISIVTNFYYHMTQEN